MSYSLSDIENKKREIEEAKNTLLNINSNFKLNIHYKLFKRVLVDNLHPNTNKKCQKDILINDEIRTCKHTIKDNKIYYLNDWGCLATAPLNISLGVS